MWKPLDVWDRPGADAAGRDAVADLASLPTLAATPLGLQATELGRALVAVKRAEDVHRQSCAQARPLSPAAVELQAAANGVDAVDEAA
jgi:hypothetical protein